MRINKPNNIDSLVFRSGYPTFGSCGHLSSIPNTYDLIYFGFKPNGILEKPEGAKLNYLA